MKRELVIFSYGAIDIVIPHRGKVLVEDYVSACPFEVQVTSYVIDFEYWTALPRSIIVAEIEALLHGCLKASTIILKRQL